MTVETGTSGFVGAKLALFFGSDLAVILRDDIAGIDWPGRLDLPGGGREGREDAASCALRETREELGIVVTRGDLVWGRRFVRPEGGHVWFFAAHLGIERLGEVVFGDEGQSWHLMSPEAYLADPLAIPHFQERLRGYLAL